jgi:ArsR family transcriptional regulator
MITQLHDPIVATETPSKNPCADNLLAVPPAATTELSAAVATMPATIESHDADDAEGHEHLLAGVPAMSEQGVKDLVKVFKLLSDETRLRILLYLTRCPELHVRAICDRLGQSQPAVSHHLALLRVAGLIESRREGKHNFYHLVPQRFEQLLEMVFETVPGEDRQIRLQDYVLRYAPQGELV